MDIQYRLATKEDVTEIFRMIHEFSIFIGDEEKLENSPEKMIKEWDHVIWCLAENSKKDICGYAAMCITYHTWKGKSAYMDDLYVRESFRGKGVGKGLLNLVTEISRNNDCIELRWMVSDWNKKAQDFYLSQHAMIEKCDYNCYLKIS